MPADSTLNSAPEIASQQPAAKPSEAPLAPSSKEHGALGESGDGGLVAPMDTLDLDQGALPLLDDGVLASGSRAVVVDTASFVSCISDSLDKPLAYLGTGRANFGLAPVIAGIHLPVTRLPNIGETVGKPVLDGRGDHKAVLSALTGVQQHAAQEEHNRRKLKSVAKEWRRIENNCRELP
ncbi:hypothetical protein AB0D62_21110 [Streptomyces massasporeus]|uniref:hypothetical protein n=1 Tax=Streptomyces massasporeus TaxID=67324 RepID=UPI0033EE480F